VTMAWFQNDTAGLVGNAVDGTRVANMVSFRPLMAIPLTADRSWVLANRLVVSGLDVPVDDRVGKLAGFHPEDLGAGPHLNPGFDRIKNFFSGRTKGFGDTIFFSMLSPNKGDSGTIWGVGPTFIFPTASEDVTGSGKYQAGPSAVLAHLGEKWTVGALAQQWWSFAGDDDRADTSHMNTQIFLQYKLPHLWQIGMTPNINVNWKAKGGEKLSLPIGIGINKVTLLFDKLPVRYGIEGQYYLIKPDTVGPEWNVRLTAIFTLPNPFMPLK
jgi:hypothetical protein